MAALKQYIQRQGTHRPISRGHVERIALDEQEHEVKLGIWYSNTKSRRERLTAPQRAALAELGVEWA